MLSSAPYDLASGTPRYFSFTDLTEGMQALMKRCLETKGFTLIRGISLMVHQKCCHAMVTRLNSNHCQSMSIAANSNYSVTAASCNKC